jgi:hypothetical protein
MSNTVSHTLHPLLHHSGITTISASSPTMAEGLQRLRDILHARRAASLTSQARAPAPPVAIDPTRFANALNEAEVSRE